MPIGKGSVLTRQGDDMLENDIQPLSIGDTFCFCCSPQVPCFNECCRDLNQFLTPGDVLRLKTYLGISSGEFLERYTHQHTGPGTGLPVVTLKPADTADRACCFVTTAGCRVYSARPASCRTYPLARAISRSRSNGRITEHFALLKEPHCQGHAQSRRQTVREWIRDQELADCNQINDLLLEIIRLKNQRLPGPLDPRQRHLFHLALYDIDAFRVQIFSKDLLAGFPMPPATLEAIRTDDLALLKLGHQWIRLVLFGPNSEGPNFNR